MHITLRLDESDLIDRYKNVDIKLISLFHFKSYVFEKFKMANYVIFIDIKGKPKVLKDRSE